MKDNDDNNGRARWPMYVDRKVDDYPLRPIEFRVYGRITSRAGFDGGWCTERAGQMARGCDISKGALSKAISFLKKANLIEANECRGASSKYRPKRPEEFVDPAQHRLIRMQVYGNPCDDGNVELLRPHHEKKKQKYSEQLDVNAAALIDAFTVTDDMRAWLTEQDPDADPRAVTSAFVMDLRAHAQQGLQVSQLNLEDRWRRFVRVGTKQKWANADRVFDPNMTDEPVEMDRSNPYDHPAVRIAETIFGERRKPNITQAEEIAATVTELPIWQLVCRGWFIDYAEPGRRPRYSKILNLYKEEVVKPQHYQSSNAQQRANAQVGSSQPNVQTEQAGIEALPDFVKTFGAESLDYGWLVELYGYDTVLEEMKRQNIDPVGRKEAVNE